MGEAAPEDLNIDCGNSFYTFPFPSLPPPPPLPSSFSHTVSHLHLQITYFTLSLPVPSFLSHTVLHLHLQVTYFTFSLPFLSPSSTSSILSSVILYISITFTGNSFYTFLPLPFSCLTSSFLPQPSYRPAPRSCQRPNRTKFSILIRYFYFTPATNNESLCGFLNFFYINAKD